MVMGFESTTEKVCVQSGPVAGPATLQADNCLYSRKFASIRGQ